MLKRDRSSVITSLFVLMAAGCGDSDGLGAKSDEATQCFALAGQACACPMTGNGVLACDGSCAPCPSAPNGAAGGLAAAGSSAAAGTGFPSGGSAGRGLIGAAGSGAAGMSAVAGRSGRGGVAGFPAPGGLAGVGGAAAGSGASGAGAVPPADGGTVSGDVPATAHCEAVSVWSASWTMFETEVLRLVNINRAMGWDCGAQGVKAAAGPLTMDPALRCSARLHSKDMAARMYFAHDNLDGLSPTARMTAAGYTGGFSGENIARGQRTPEQVVAGWMDSDGHCSNIMSANFTLIGVGYFEGMAMSSRFNGELYWTQNFGAAARPRR